MLTVKQAADKLNVSPGLVYKLIDQGTMACYRIASSIRISEEDLEQFKRLSREKRPGKPVVKPKVKLKGLRVQSIE